MSRKEKKSRCVFKCPYIWAAMHRFPHPIRKPELFAQWMSVVSETCQIPYSDPASIYISARVCDYHFKPEEKVACHRLLAGTVPSLHLNGVGFTLGIVTQLDHNYCFPQLDKYEAMKLYEKNAKESFNNQSRRQVEPNSVEPDAKSNHGNAKYFFNDKSRRQVELKAEEPVETETYDGIDSADLLSEDDHSPHAPEIAAEEEIVFSWQKKTENIADDAPDTDDGQEVYQSDLDVSLYEDEPKGTAAKPVEDTTFRCNICENNITGFRYTCVQCADWDLCGACEARAAHGAHYMLRVPRARPYKETQAILGTIRLQLLSSVFLQEDIDCVKEEVKDEPAEESHFDPLVSKDQEQTDGANSVEDRSTVVTRSRKRRIESDCDDPPFITVVPDETISLNRDTVHSNTKCSEPTEGIHILSDETIPTSPSPSRTNPRCVLKNICNKRLKADEKSTETKATNAKRLENGSNKSNSLNKQSQVTPTVSRLPNLPVNQAKPKQQLFLKVPPGMDPNNLVKQLQLVRAPGRLEALNSNEWKWTTK